MQRGEKEKGRGDRTEEGKGEERGRRKGAPNVFYFFKGCVFFMYKNSTWGYCCEHAHLLCGMLASIAHVHERVEVGLNRIAVQ